jgi:hypothetical protein
VFPHTTAILMNVREVVQLSGSWDDERDALGELNKTVMPILIASLDFDIQKAAEEVKQIIESGVSNRKLRVMGC